MNGPGIDEPRWVHRCELCGRWSIDRLPTLPCPSSDDGAHHIEATPLQPDQRRR